MSLWKNLLVPDEPARQKRYEKAKERVMKLHEKSNRIFYIDEVLPQEGSGFALVGVIGKGSLQKGLLMHVYQCDGTYVMDMNVDHFSETEGGIRFFSITDSKVYVHPVTEDSRYLAGQLLVTFPEDT